MPTRPNIIKEILQYLWITLGLAVFTFAYSTFLQPNQVISGGVAGFSSIVFFLTGFSMGITNLIVNIIFVLLGIKFLGGRYGIKSIYGIVASSLLFVLWQQVLHVEHMFDVNQFGTFMCTIIGGALCGFGIGMAMNSGGNSGGTDILATIISSRHNVSPGKVILFFDIVIIACIYFVSHRIENVVFGYIVMLVKTYVLDLTVDGAKASYQIIVFSKQAATIGAELTKTPGHGATLLDGRGCYTRSTQEVLMLIVHKDDKALVMSTINAIDPTAFVSVARVQGVYGKNFDTIKDRKHRHHQSAAITDEEK